MQDLLKTFKDFETYLQNHSFPVLALDSESIDRKTYGELVELQNTCESIHELLNGIESVNPILNIVMNLQTLSFYQQSLTYYDMNKKREDMQPQYVDTDEDYDRFKQCVEMSNDPLFKKISNDEHTEFESPIKDWIEFVETEINKLGDKEEFSDDVFTKLYSTYNYTKQVRNKLKRKPLSHQKFDFLFDKCNFPENNKKECVDFLNRLKDHIVNVYE